MSYKMNLTSKEQLKQKKCTFCDHYKMFHPSGIAKCLEHDETLLNLDGCPDWVRKVGEEKEVKQDG